VGAIYMPAEYERGFHLSCGSSVAVTFHRGLTWEKEISNTVIAHKVRHKNNSIDQRQIIMAMGGENQKTTSDIM
jgi:hypothetical protein